MTPADWQALSIIGAIAVAAVVLWTLILIALGRTNRSNARLDNSRQAPEDDDGGEPAVVVHLVKGTYSGLPFGQQPAWTRPGSKLRTRLARAFGGRVQFACANWSTMNSFGARQRGAQALREDILASAAQWPRARQVIVGHSHGGTVAVEAMQDERVEARVDAVVCLATPFLQSTLFHDPDAGKDHRELKKTLGPMMAFVLLVAVCAVFDRRYLLPDWFWNWLALAHAPLVQRLAGALLGVTAVLGFVWVAKRWLRPVRSKWRSLIAEATAAPKLNPDKLLILRQPGDEAHALVGTLMLASWLASVVSALTVLPLQFADRLVSGARKEASAVARFPTSAFGLFACVSMAALIGGALFALRTESLPSLQTGSALFLMTTMGAVMLLWCAFGAIYGALWLLEWASRFLVALGTGYELAFAGSGLLVTPEATPPGVWRVHNLDIGGPDALNRPVRGRLWHSHLYSDDLALDQMAAHVTSRAASRVE